MPQTFSTLHTHTWNSGKNCHVCNDDGINNVSLHVYDKVMILILILNDTVNSSTYITSNGRQLVMDEFEWMWKGGVIA
jgi:hypothetical protein